MRRRQEPVAIGGRTGILADRQDKLGEHGTLEFDQFLLAGRRTALQQPIAQLVW